MKENDCAKAKEQREGYFIKLDIEKYYIGKTKTEVLESLNKEAIMAKGLKLNREQYKRVKRMDHKQMEDFICNMYNEGYADGKAAAEPRIKPSDIATVLIEIKGVGTKKAAEIMAAVNKLYERGAQ